MSILEVFLTGLGLSMDAVAVSMTDAMVYSKTKGRLMLLPFVFGFFQAAMPIGGFYLADIFSSHTQKYAGIIAFLILAAIGINMIRESHGKDKNLKDPSLSFTTIFAQGIATSIDAFAVGAGLAFLGSRFKMNIAAAAGLIGCVTFCCSFIALLIGKKFGDALENKAEAFGGIILIAIGVKSLLGF